MEVDKRVPGNAGVTCMAAPTSTRCPYHHLEATYSYSTVNQTPDSPHSIHTDTDVAMEMGGLSVSSSRPDSRKVTIQTEAPCESTRMLSTPDLVTSITKGMAAVATEILERFTRPLLVDDATDTALWERFQQWRATASQPAPSGPEATGHQPAFDQLGHWVQSPQKDDQWAPRPKMTPQRVERGRQQNRDQEPLCSTSQKRCSQSRSRDEVDSKKGHTEGDWRSSKVQVGIDWANTGIQKPVPKPDSCHPSFKSDPSGAGNNPQPQMKSAVVPKGSQRQGSSCSATTRPQEQSGGRAGSGASRSGPTKLLGDPEKRELKEKLYNWITTRMNHLDPKGYVEEINSFRHFGKNTRSLALEIIAIIDWGRKYVDAGFHYPIPMFPHYLFKKFARSPQGGGQVPNKPDHLAQAGGDVRAKCTEAWIWMASILQFWTDEASITDGEMFGGRTHPASALVEYVMSTMNRVLEP